MMKVGISRSPSYIPEVGIGWLRGSPVLWVLPLKSFAMDLSPSFFVSSSLPWVLYNLALPYNNSTPLFSLSLLVFFAFPVSFLTVFFSFKIWIYSVDILLLLKLKLSVILSFRFQRYWFLNHPNPHPPPPIFFLTWIDFILLFF